MDNHDWTSVVRVGTQLAARHAPAAPEADTSDVAAGGALGGLLSADRAVPVPALALEGSQVLAALGADRWRDRCGAGLAEPDEQIADGPGRRGPAVGQDGGPLGPGFWVCTPRHRSILRAVDDGYRAIVAEVTPTPLLATVTRRLATQDAMTRLSDRGISGFTDRADSRWQLTLLDPQDQSHEEMPRP
ncbi:hypothetical protein ACWCQW_53395 [Streptomyces mirabilis]